MQGNAMPAPDRGSMRRRARRNALINIGQLVAATCVYAFVPWNGITPGRTFVVVATFVGGLVGAAALVVWQVHTYRQSAASGVGQIRGLLLAVYVAMLFFATAYYLLATGNPDQIVGLKTRTDSLYFTLTILSTVGFGDIHAAGQAARAMVSLQIGFDLLVIGIALTVAKAAGVPDRRQP